MYFMFCFLSVLGMSNILVVRCMMVKMNVVDVELYRFWFIFCVISYFVCYIMFFIFS